MPLKSAFRNAANMFTSTAASALDTATAKLADYDRQIAEQQAKIDDLALQAVRAGAADDDLAGLADANEKLTRLRQLRAAAEQLVQEAREQERQRLSEVRKKGNATKLAALRQHAGSAKRAAEKISAGLAMADEGFREALEISGKVETLVGFHDWYTPRTSRPSAPATLNGSFCASCAALASKTKAVRKLARGAFRVLIGRFSAPPATKIWFTK